MEPVISPNGADARRKIAVLDAMGRILQSDVIGERSRLRRLLRHLVVEELEGRGDELKAYSIGVDVLGRAEDFDPVADSVVRVEMNRLRQALRQYYAEYGGADPVRIDVPRGGYRPRIISTAYENHGDDIEEDTEEDGAATREWLGAKQWLVLAAVVLAIGAGGIAISWSGAWRPATIDAPPTDSISVVVAEFRSLSRDAIVQASAADLSRSLTAALSRNNTLTVLSGRAAPSPKAATALYTVQGSVRPAGDRAQIIVELVEASTHAILWARAYRRPLTEITEENTSLVAAIAQELQTRIVNAAKEAGAERDPATLSAWELYVQATWEPGTEKSNSLEQEEKRVALAERAISIDPDLGEAHSVIADVLAYLANADPPSDTPERRAAAASHARKAIELAPSNPKAMLNVALYYFHSGNSDGFHRASRRVLELDPNHLGGKLWPAASHNCARPPPNILQDLVALDAALDQNNPARWIVLAWISAMQLNLGDYTAAVATLERTHQILGTNVTHYRLAALRHRLGDTETAIAGLEKRLENWPNLDPRHYADVVIPRVCAGGELTAEIQALYAEFADAWSASRAR